jgi:hypothetical protein
MVNIKTRFAGAFQSVEKVFSTLCEWKAGKPSFHSIHQFAVKRRSQAKMPGNALFTAAN